MKLTIATKNEHKVEELQHMLNDLDFQVCSLFDHPEIGDIVEDGKTFKENALIKAREVWKRLGGWVLADDSGLVVEALDGAPGIFSSRYSGKEKDYAANNEKLLEEMKGIPGGKRDAAFVCVMALISPEGKEYTVEGRCEGEIAKEYQGVKGFGYDPLFWLPEFGKMMAELEMAEKNKISHRGRALEEIHHLLLDLFSKEV